MITDSDIIIIGAGIAGASLASELSDTHNVILLEREDHAGYHATGRSAAIFLPTYGPAVIQALTKASGAFFHNTPKDFCPTPLLSPRSTMMVAKTGDEAHINEALAVGMCEIDISETQKRIPPLNTNLYNRAFVDDDTSDIEVDVLLHAHLKKFKQNGGKLLRRSEVTAIEKTSDGWKIQCKNETYTGAIIVNAAGAWADTIATMANLPVCNLHPKRRSAALIDVSTKWDSSTWPLTVGAGNTFYFRPMGAKLMISPADETVTQAHDAWADDMALAQAMELFGEATGYDVTHVEHSWAGLRTFAPDGDPVVGFDPQANGFFWLAGQGGYGIQTSPALSRLAAALIRGQEIPQDIAEFGVKSQLLSPDRF